MPRDLVAIHRPADYNPAVAKDAAMDRAINVLNEEMVGRAKGAS
ncbi:MAG: hypothetical protein QG602_3611 [Verrucomicrobiota bacterium]|nr:hypothetical protein [Verrucomicrobiota bacterium]